MEKTFPNFLFGYLIYWLLNNYICSNLLVSNCVGFSSNFEVMFLDDTYSILMKHDINKRKKGGLWLAVSEVSDHDH